MAEIIQSKPLVNNTFKVTLACTPTHGAITEGAYTWDDMFYRYAGEALTFTATVAGKPTETVLGYDWDFGDGTKMTTPSNTVTYTYHKPMPTIAHVRVRLGNGKVYNASLNLSLTQAPELLLNNNGEVDIDNWFDYDDTDTDYTFTGSAAFPSTAPTGATEGFELAASSAVNVQTSQNFAVTAGSRYKYEAYLLTFGAITHTVRIEIRNGGTVVSTIVLSNVEGAWVHLARSFVAPTTGSYQFRIRNDLGFLGGNTYFTGASVKLGY